MGYIKKEFIDSLLDKVSLEDVISDFVTLKKVGANLQGKSPFVEEKTPSFVVSPVKNFWKDFSSGKGGNVVNFLMEKENLSYTEAIEYLANKYSETVLYENAEVAQRKRAEIDIKEELRPILKKAHELYIEEYKKLEENHAAIIEVEQKRGYTQDDIIEWGIGYAPENFIYDKLKNSGKVKQGEALGLIREGKYNNKYDFYTNKVIYPIHDENGLIIGLAGRNLKAGAKPKWINPIVETSNVLYQKSKVWYGLHKAKSDIRFRNEVFVVEGYNDVIAWHKHGVINTIAPCGTAIAPNQLNVIKRLTDKIVFCMDPDDAGMRAVLKQIPLCLEKGFRVEVIILPLDPDDFSRVYKSSIEYYGLREMLKEPNIRKDGFLMLMENELVGDALDYSNGAKRLCKIISKIEDDATSIIYEKWLASESKVALKQIKDWIKEQKEALKKEENEKGISQYDYELPLGVSKSLKELVPDIKNYGMFQDNNQIYVSLGENSDGKIRFSSISNFSIEILQHMNDEKFPKKLLRIKNIFNKEVIFDTNSENLNSLQVFFNTLTGQGNFRFDGTNNHLKILIKYLMDKMGDGKKIDVLGWQPDAEFFVFNNRVINGDGEEIEIDDNGVIVYKQVHYYVPSANKIYKNASNKYSSQKRFKVIENSLSFNLYLSKVREVHREHAITGILFAIASLFQDIIVKELESFPIMFLYGPGSSGKDELARIVQSFTGIPQSPINLEGGASTMKAQIREFAQFRNGISQLSEYKRGDVKLDGMLKGLWDRNGYKRGNLESLVSSEEIPIEASVILTGNEYPSPEALITRLLWNEMVKNEFTEEEMNKFDELKDMTAKGLSGYAFELLKDRKRFKEEFSKNQRIWKAMINQEIPGARGRMVTNYSILATVYSLFKDTVLFPFTQAEMLNYFKICVDQQLTKINNSSITNRFWEMFVTALRGNKDDRLQANQIVSVESTNLYFNWKHTYSKLQRMWFQHYQEAAPSNSSLLEALKKAGFVVANLTHHAFKPGRPENGGIKTSAIQVDMNKLEEELKNDIIGSIMFQLNQQELASGQANIFSPPVTPDENGFIEEIEKLDF